MDDHLYSCIVLIVGTVLIVGKVQLEVPTLTISSTSLCIPLQEAASCSEVPASK